MRKHPTILKSLVFTLLVISIALAPVLSAQPLEKRSAAAGLAPCAAMPQLPQGTIGPINVGITCDNDFAAYLGDCCSATTFISGNSCEVTNACIRHGQTFTIPAITGSSFLYIVAWSDSFVAQGLLVSLGPGPVSSTPPGAILGGDLRWQVYATGMTPFPQSPPSGADNSFPAPKKKFQKFLNAQLALACERNLWTTPTNGGSNASGNNGLEPPVSVVDPNALWMWFKSNKPACAGPQSPFAPGCDHGEFLIFRFPLTYV